MSIKSEAASWTVLIVEDDPDNLGVPQAVLTFYGAQVVTAQDGLEGLQVLDRVRPTFILLDLSMPNMDGWEMLKRVRANPDISSIPVIALTAHAMEQDVQRAKAAGFDGYITKPFWLDTFWDEINLCLSKLAKAGQVRS
jgi:CheY-like chemotaxis protein